MPNNSCTVILNGHGRFDHSKIVYMMTSPVDYSIVFLCKHGETITASHHNLILASLSCCPVDQIIPRLQIIEAPGTTSIINKQAPALAFITDMKSSRLNIFYEHVISNAPEMVDAHTLEHINGQLGNPIGRFQGAALTIIKDPINPRNWGDGNLYFEFDIIQSEVDIRANMQYDSSALSANNLLCIRPIAPDGQNVTFLLSDLISNILPRIKIFASKHQDGSVNVLPNVFLDDRNDPIQNLIDLAQDFPVFQNVGDRLHELTIAGDANIIWDSCREM